VSSVSEFVGVGVDVVCVYIVGNNIPWLLHGCRRLGTPCALIIMVTSCFQILYCSGALSVEIDLLSTFNFMLNY
jgi:hypothetical protein